MQVALLAQVLEETEVSSDVCLPRALAVLISGAALELVSEAAIGVTEAHAETYAFIKQHIQRVENAKAAWTNDIMSSGGRRTYRDCFYPLGS